VLGCALLFLVGVQPPHQLNLWTVLGTTVLLACLWFIRDRKTFRGPPNLIQGKKTIWDCPRGDEERAS
jgi:hypothetical protein